MPSGDEYGNMTLPGGHHHIQGFTGTESALAKFLYPYAWRDTVFVFDDFTGSVLDTHYWTASNTNGTAFIPAGTQIANGSCQGITNNVGGDEQALYGDAAWAGDNNCGLELMWNVDNITQLVFELGFTDPISAATASVIDDIDTPAITNNATTVALIGMDTAQDLKTMAFITDGNTSGQNTTKTDLGTRTPTNSTNIITRVQLAGDAACCYLFDENGNLTESAQHGYSLATQVEGGDLLMPWFYWEPVTTAARTINIDYIAVWQDRATR